MANISENLQTLKTAKDNIKAAIEGKGQDLTNIPFTEYANKIRAIQTGSGEQSVLITKEITENGTYNASNDNADGYSSVVVNVPSSGGDCDLIDVTSLPTENVQDDKVYRVIKASGEYYISGGGSDVVTLIDMFRALGAGGASMQEIIVASIDDVTNPKIIDENGVYIYTDSNSYIGYVFMDESTRLTLSEFLNMAGLDIIFTDKGKVNNTSEMTEAGGVYYIQNATKETTIGVPNVETNKSVYKYNGSDWVEIGTLTQDMLVGIWTRGIGEGIKGSYLEFKPDGRIFEDGGYSYTSFYHHYTIGDGGMVLITDLDGTFLYKYMVLDGVPTLIRNHSYESTTEIFAQKVTRIKPCDLIDEQQSPSSTPSVYNNDKIFRATEITNSGEYYLSLWRKTSKLTDYIYSLNIGITNIQEQLINSLAHIPDTITTPPDLYIFTDKTTRCGYVNIQNEETGEIYTITLSEYLNRLNILTDGNRFVDNGFVRDVSNINSDTLIYGIYYVADYTTNISVPNANKDKKIYEFNGTEWTELGTGGGTGTDRLQWKCDNVKRLYYEFSGYQGESLDEALIGLDTSQVTDFANVFSGCSKLKSIPTLDTSNATTLYYAFNGCNNLESIPELNTSNVTNFSYAFYACSKLTTIPNMDTSKATTFSNAFAACIMLKTISPLNCSFTTSLSYAFHNCKALTEITINNTSLVSNWSNTFYNCQNLVTINGELDFIKGNNNISNVFYSCPKLTNIKVRNIKGSIMISSSPLWSNASLLNIGQELWDNYGNALGGARTITMSTASKTAIQSIYVKLIDVTDEMIANDQYISNKKPCVECASTDEGAMTLEEYIISKGWNIG